MKGIILAGGKGTRLYPLTRVICKQLLPVYDKPMIYYPLSALMLAGIRDILIISTPEDLPRFEHLFGNGQNLGLTISYAPQAEPRGIADSFIIGKKFIGSDPVCLILGDNIFFGHGLPDLLREAATLRQGAIIFGYYVDNPQRFGVIEFDREQNVISIEEKPEKPKSKWIATGIYFYDSNVVNIAQNLTPSRRNELEITDINKEYLKAGNLKVTLLGRGFAWLDTGTHEALIEASSFMKTVEDRQGLKIGCIEEIAYRMGYIDDEKLTQITSGVSPEYGEYLLRVARDF